MFETTNQNIFQYHTDQWIIDNTHPSKDSEMQPKRGNKTSMDTFFVGYVTMYVCPPPCGCWSLGYPQFCNQNRWLPMKQHHGNPMNFHEISHSNNMKSPIFIHFPWCFHVGSVRDTPRGSNPAGFPRCSGFFSPRAGSARAEPSGTWQAQCQCDLRRINQPFENGKHTICLWWLGDDWLLFYQH